MLLRSKYDNDIVKEVFKHFYHTSFDKVLSNDSEYASEECDVWKSTDGKIGARIVLDLDGKDRSPPRLKFTLCYLKNVIMADIDWPFTRENLNKHFSKYTTESLLHDANEHIETKVNFTIATNAKKEFMKSTKSCRGVSTPKGIHIYGYVNTDESLTI